MILPTPRDIVSFRGLACECAIRFEWAVMANALDRGEECAAGVGTVTSRTFLALSSTYAGDSDLVNFALRCWAESLPLVRRPD